MPDGEDYTAEIRKADSVQEYVLIGQDAGGCCGHQWKTWGHSLSRKDAPPYERDGFNKTFLADLGELQTSRLDRDRTAGRSSTVSFRRVRPAFLD